MLRVNTGRGEGRLLASVTPLVGVAMGLITPACLHWPLRARCPNGVRVTARPRACGSVDTDALGEGHRELLGGRCASPVALRAVKQHDRALGGGLDHQPLSVRWQRATWHELDVRDGGATLQGVRWHTPQMARLATVRDAAGNPPDPAGTARDLANALAAEVDGGDVVEGETLRGRPQGRNT